MVLGKSHAGGVVRLEAKIDSGMSYIEYLTIIIIFLLGVDVLGHVFIAFINPEAFFFGKKLGGTSAFVYLLTNATVAAITIIAILQNLKIGALLSIMYFGYNFAESVITSTKLLNKPFLLMLPPLPTVGLILSILLFVLCWCQSGSKEK